MSIRNRPVLVFSSYAYALEKGLYIFRFVYCVGMVGLVGGIVGWIIMYRVLSSVVTHRTVRLVEFDTYIKTSFQTTLSPGGLQ